MGRAWSITQSCTQRSRAWGGGSVLREKYTSAHRACSLEDLGQAISPSLIPAWTPEETLVPEQRRKQSQVRMEKETEGRGNEAEMGTRRQ